MGNFVRKVIGEESLADLVSVRSAFSEYFDSLIMESASGEVGEEARNAIVFGDLVGYDLPNYIGLFALLMLELNKIDPEGMLDALDGLVAAIQQGTIYAELTDLEGRWVGLGPQSQSRQLH